MAGAPRGKVEPRPSYETGELRDPDVARMVQELGDEPAEGERRLKSLIAKAAWSKQLTQEHQEKVARQHDRFLG